MYVTLIAAEGKKEIRKPVEITYYGFNFRTAVFKSHAGPLASAADA